MFKIILVIFPFMALFANEVLVYCDAGAGASCLRHTFATLESCLPDGYILKGVSAKEVIETDWERDCALFVMPGGADLPYVQALRGRGNERIRVYVNGGGNYLGICAGSYYAGHSVAFAEGTELEVVGERELQFFPGPVIGPVYPEFDYKSNRGARAVAIQTGDDESLKLFYHGGGSFPLPAASSACQVIATYADFGTVAIVLCPVGKGKALLSAVHFEWVPELLDEKDPYLQKLIPSLKESDASRKRLISQLLSDLLAKNWSGSG